VGTLFGRLRQAANEQFGQSMVELALLLPILVFGLIGGADLARAFALQLAVQNGARAGAEAYAITFSPTPALAQARAKDEMARTPGMDVNNPALLQTFVDVTQADGVTPCLRPPTVATPCFVTVEVQYIFHTIVPWPFIPNTANFDRSTTMRTFY
jgi:Flp pilus assembly protein TadG